VFQIEWTVNAAPVGVLSLEGSANAGSAPFNGTGPGSGYVPIPVTSGFYGAWPNVAIGGGTPAELTAVIVIANPLRWHRIHYERTSGGANSQFTISVLKRKFAPHR
jgi:hypothetical protein